MDPKSLLNESASFRSMIEAHNEIDVLAKSAGLDGADEIARLHASLSKPSAGLLPAFSSMAEQEAAKLLQLDTGSLPGLTGGGADAAADLTHRYSEMASGRDALQAFKQSKEFGAVDWTKIDREAKEREEMERINQSMEISQNIQRGVIETRRREDAKLDYARRSAEASEAVLAEERRKRDRAERAAEQAKIDKEIAETRAERAERREIRMMRLAILGLIGTVAGMVVSAWQPIRDALGI